MNINGEWLWDAAKAADELMQRYPVIITIELVTRPGAGFKVQVSSRTEELYSTKLVSFSDVAFGTINILALEVQTNLDNLLKHQKLMRGK